MDIWTTKNGDEIAVKDMTRDHILNCIRYLEKQLETGNTTYFVGGGNDAEEMWGEEIDDSDKMQAWVKTFKLELMWREYQTIL